MSNKYKINFLVWIFYRAGSKFRNFVFRKRLGKKRWSAKIIFSIMSFFELFEQRAYINSGEAGKFDHYVSRLLLNRWRIAETDIDKGKIFCFYYTPNGT